jgi:hypothetical protein
MLQQFACSTATLFLCLPAQSCTMWIDNLGLDDFLVTRRKDPNYAQVTSHIPKDLAKRLKFYCTEYETTITDVVEIAIREFLDNRQNQSPSPTKGKGE